MRFVNWLANGQPTGTLTGDATADAPLTENGSYLTSGMTTFGISVPPYRNANATWVIPSENEWYKAAYYDPNKPEGPGYWDYPTRSDAAPSNALLPTGTNNANFLGNDYTIGAPYYRSLVGAFEGSPGPYGTFDQAGNVAEWTESPPVEWQRVVRGGSFSGVADDLSAPVRAGGPFTPGYLPDYENYDVGFRVAYLPESGSPNPEPGTAAMLACAALALLFFRRHRKR